MRVINSERDSNECIQEIMDERLDEGEVEVNRNKDKRQGTLDVYTATKDKIYTH